jgi:mannobiose 2-epimerase
LELFSLIEAKCTDRFGYGEAFASDFIPTSNEKLSENGIIASRTMNTLLHVFEAYACLYAVSRDGRVMSRLRKLSDIFLTKVFAPEHSRLNVFFDDSMRSLIDLQSYGHDIEASWLLDLGVSLIGDGELQSRMNAMTSCLVEKVYASAFHRKSLWNECENGVNDKTRVWWVQAEAVIGFLNAYQKAPLEKRFQDAACDVLGYIEDTLIDPRPDSEWFWEAGEDDVPNTKKPIAGPWKCPYHNGRMCIEIIRRDIDV